MIVDLVVAIDAVEAAEGLRALLLRGEGKVFSAEPTWRALPEWVPMRCAR